MNTTKIRKTMKRIVLILVLLCSTPLCSIAAEHILQGRVIDSALGSGVGYATVVLSDAEGKGVAAVAADKEGSFTLRYNKEGSYTLTFSSVGYASVDRKITLGNADEQTDLGKVALQAGVEIEGITVKPLVMEMSDRLVYNVKADPEAKYRKMATIVDKVPGLDQSGSRGKFQYNNLPISKILINGKEEVLISGGRQYTMEFIGAALMDEIEVIMPGSPEYNNDQIILNIKTNQPLPVGFASELGGDAAVPNGKYGADVDVVSKVGRTTFATKYAYSLTHTPTLHKRSTSEYFGTEGGDTPLYTLHDSDADSTRGHSHRLAISYKGEINKRKGYILATLNGTSTETNRLSRSDSWREEAGGVCSQEQQSDASSTTSSPENINGRITMAHQVGAKHAVNLYSTLTHSKSNSEASTLTHYGEDNTSYESRRSSQTEQDAFSIFLSLSKRAGKEGKHNLYPSIGYTSRRYDNSSLYETLNRGEEEFATIPNAGLTYKQDIISGGFNYSYSPSRKFSLGMSANLSNDHTTGVFRHTGNTPLDYNQLSWGVDAQIFIRTHWLVPNIMLSAEPKRPGLDLLNPYVDDSNPMHLRYGNPNLRPEMNYRGSLAWSLPDKLLPKWLRSPSLHYFGSYIANSINPITEMRSDGVTVSTYKNYGSEIGHRIVSNILMYPTKNTHLEFNGSYSIRTYNIAEDYTNTIRSFTWDVGGGYRFPKGKWLNNARLSASYSASPTARMAQVVDFGYYHNLGVSFSAYIPKWKAGFDIKVGDILHGHNYVENTIRSGTFIRHNSNEMLGRSVNISAYIRFGKFKRVIGEIDEPTDLKSF